MGSSKIPTIIYYDQQGKVCAVGAEAVREGIEEEAEDGNWVKAEWYGSRPSDLLMAFMHLQVQTSSSDQVPLRYARHNA
jgi:hypothetical protein